MNGGRLGDYGHDIEFGVVPQTSPYFATRAQFDLECFRRQMIGMTTSACVMESAGISD
jgi:hypothetical protein